MGLMVPVRLDRLVPGHQRSATRPDERRRRLLTGGWIVLTAVLGVAFVGADLLLPSRAIGVLGALVTAVPGSMAVLRGVVDAVGPVREPPRYTTGSGTWLACYLVAAAGLGLAFLA